MVLALTSCSGQEQPQAGDAEGQPPASSQPEFILKAQGTGALGGYTDPLYLGFKEKVENYSNGRIKVDFYPAQSLAPDREYIEMMQQGSTDVFMGSTLTMGLFDSAWDVLHLPYLIPDRDTLFALLDGEPGQVLADRALDLDLRVLAWAESSPRQFSNNKREIRTPEDMKGIRFRSPETRPMEDWMSSLGADPVPLSFPELMPALQQGVVDGQDIGIVTAEMMNFHEVQKYWTLDDHLIVAVPVMISEKTWQELPPELQQAVQKAATEAALDERKAAVEEEKRMIEFCEENGVKVTILSPEEKAAFEETAIPIYGQYASTIGEDVMDVFFNALGKSYK